MPKIDKNTWWNFSLVKDLTRNDEIQKTSYIARLSYEKPEVFFRGLNILETPRQQFLDELKKIQKNLDIKANHLFQITSIETKKNGQAYVVEDKERVIVSFRGTFGVYNMYQDIKVKKQVMDGYLGIFSKYVKELDWKSQSSPRLKAIDSEQILLQDTRVKIHSGFLEVYLSLRNQIFKIIKKIPAEKKIIFTGHSLGGALATLAGFDTGLNLNERLSQIKVITYGTPRIGNVAFFQAYSEIFAPDQYIRIINNNDPVMEFPSRKLGYFHVAQELKPPFLLEDSSDRIKSGIVKVLDCKQSFGLCHLNYLGVDYLSVLLHHLSFDRYFKDTSRWDQKVCFFKPATKVIECKYYLNQTVTDIKTKSF